MEPASQKETSPLDRFAINSLPHKSSAISNVPTDAKQKMGTSASRTIALR